MDSDEQDLASALLPIRDCPCRGDIPMRDLAATPAERLRPDGLVGTVLLANVKPVPDRLVEHFVDMAGGDDAQVVVVVAREKPLSDEDEAKLLAP